MDFIMHACKKNNVSAATRWTITCLFFLAISVSMAGEAAADFSVVKPGSILTGKTMELSGQLDLDLSTRVEEALGKGIPLDVTIQARLYRERNLIWDTLIANWSFVHSIQYHALSRQYLVRGHGVDAEIVESFTTLQEALTYMGALDGLVLPLPHKLMAADTKNGAPQYNGQLRARLAIETLPAPLRPVAYTSADWRLNTGWVKWKVTQ
jgi:hypothetical protein